MKATEKYFPVVLSMLYKVVQTFASVDEILKCDHSNESCSAVISCCTVCYAVQDDFESVDEILNSDIHLKAAEQHRLSCGTFAFLSEMSRKLSNKFSPGGKELRLKG